MKAIAMISLVWAAVYLPGLGSLEIKGEEGRRILPAIAMIESSDAARGAGETIRSYIVPRIGSEAYLRKPPLINWLVAASFKIFGQRTEWTARLPSALSVLIVAIVFVIVARPSLGAPGSTIAALVWLTNVGIIEKGRLTEIEALYASLFALAIICWLAFWEQKRSAWLTWFVPWIFLGLGWLAKGPLHLFFFYAMVLAVLWRAGQVRVLWNVPHLIGIIVMLSIFAAWAIPFAQMTGQEHTAHVWAKQFSGRLTESIHWKSWALNIPRSLVYFLPWLGLLPFVASRGHSSSPIQSSQLLRRSRRLRWTGGLRPPSALTVEAVGSIACPGTGRPRLQSALTWGIVVPLVIVDLIPGALPRYTLPLAAPFAWLLGSMVGEETGKWQKLVMGGIVMATCVAIWIYAFAIIPRLRPRLRPIAAKIEEIVPESERLYAIDPDYQPFLFYVHRPIIYVGSATDLPGDTKFFLVRWDDEDAALSAGKWPRTPSRVLSIQDYRDWHVSLFAVP
ncbi:MAG: ArnT family glycosyltransferase [Chthoniobacterales bacterium]